MKPSILTLVTIRVSGTLALLSILALLPMQSARAVTTDALNCTPEYQIVRTFSNGAKWEMCWEPRAGYGYRLSKVIFTPPNGIRRKVLDSIHVAQLFVPYDDNTARFFDISYGANLAVLTADDCPSGVLLTNSTLCLVYRAPGYLYKNVNKSTPGPLSAQDESFAVFGYFALGNYYYIFQYTFFPDGSIAPSLGASGSLQRYGATASTGWPIGNNPIQMGVNHNHLAIWRMDFDLDGSANNRVERVSFAGAAGSDQRNMTATPLTTEIKETNNLTNLTFWRVRNTVENNVDGRSISYEIEPTVTDQLRAPEDFTNNDFYLTEYRSTEELVDSGLVGFVNGETVTDPVLWYGVNFHHVPRGEDDVEMPAHWQGFRIRPRDVTIGLAAGPVNRPPTITSPGNQNSTAGTAISNLAISASDPDGHSLTYSATGLPPGLSINSGGGVISGTPTIAGSFNTSVTVNDGHGGITSTPSFTWTVAAGGGPGTQTFSAPAAITINDNAAASPYPASVTVSGMSGIISKVAVKLKGLTHTYPADLDVMLVSPGGQKVMLMSDAGGGTAVSGIALTFDSAASAAVPTTALTTGTYLPANYDTTTDAFPAPAPASPYSTVLTAFNGSSPNGDWKLFVRDDAGGDTGMLSGGFDVTITTAAPGANTPPVITNPGPQTTPVNTSVSLQIVATDADSSDTLTYSASGLPAGLSINSATGLITGTTANAAFVYPTVTVTVNDGRGGIVSTPSFTWTVAAAGGPGTQTFSAPAAITINDNAAASPYPASVTVLSMSGTISKVAVTIKGLTHTFLKDLDILLVSPGGQKVMLMSDAGGVNPGVSGINLTFDAAAASAVPVTALTAPYVYKPRNYDTTTDAFPAPAPASPYSTALTAFNGSSPNGAWKLFVRDDGGGDTGVLSGGFTLTITTQ